MKQALKKQKSQLLLLADMFRRYPSFEFGTGKTDAVAKARSLVVKISRTLFLENSSIKRMQNADMRWTQLKATKVVYNEMDAKYALMVCKPKPHSGIDYAFFLSPWGHKATEA